MRSLRSRITGIWLLLVLATLFSVLIFEALQSAQWSRYAGLAVIGIAFVKVRFIGLDFMELRAAPKPMRIVFEVWLVSVCAVLMGMYWLR